MKVNNLSKYPEKAMKTTPSQGKPNKKIARQDLKAARKAIRNEYMSIDITDPKEGSSKDRIQISAQVTWCW